MKRTGINRQYARQDITARREQGFSLIEVLIAMVVIAVGLLGFLGMQVYAVKGNDSAYLRSQATLLAYELADNMRASRQAALDGDFDDGGSERAGWDARLVTVLGPGAAGTVVRNDNSAVITVAWTDDRAAVTDKDGVASADASGGSLSFETEF